MENNEKAGSEGAVFSGSMAALQQSLERMENGLREKSGFEPMAALRAAQVKLSALRQSEGDTPSVLDQIERFIHSGCAIGVLIDNEDDRWSAQSVLDYWANLLLRAQRQRPEATLAEFDPEQAPELPDEKCPYLGLNAFQENDGPRFFGRSALIEQMVERLRSNRLLAVVGPSGSGKSSLVLAGLLPKLRKASSLGPEAWRIRTMMPGTEPLVVLSALQLAPEQEPPLLVVVDQFEEVFTLCEKEAVRQQFIDALLSLVSAKVEHRLILTVRSDFESYVAKYEALYKLYGAGRVPVTPLSAAELRDAIEKPAEQVGLKFEEGVEDNLLHDLLGEPAGLPLLQFTLLMLWEERQRNRITLATYKRLGGGRKALSNSADAVYQAMIPQEQATAKRLLLRLSLALDDRLEVTRSRVPHAKLYLPGEDPSRVDRVLEKLVSARLLRRTPGPSAAEDQIEVAHEALVRNWPTLAQWLQEARGALSERQRLESRAHEWVRLGRGSSGLFDEVEVAEAERWLKRPEAAYLDSDPDLDALIQASRRALTAAAQQKEEAQRRELELAFQRQRAEEQQKLAQMATQLADEQTRLALRTRSLLALVSGILVIALAIAWYASKQQRAATDALNLAEEREVARMVETGRQLLVERDQPIEALLWLQRAKQKGSRSTILPDLIREAARPLDTVQLVLRGHTSRVNSASYSPDATRIVTASDDNTARVWDAHTGQLLTTLQGHSGRVKSAIYSPDASRIVTASADNTVRVWNARSGQLLTTLQGHLNTVNSANYSSDATRIVTASSDKTARIWDAHSGQLLTTLQSGFGIVYSARYSPDSTRIVTASDDDTARVWDTHTGKLLLMLQQAHTSVTTARFSPDGARIVSAGFRDDANVWDAHSGRLLFTLTGHTDRVSSASFSPDASRIVTASDDNTARVWDTYTGELLATLKGHTGEVNSASYSPDASRIVTASEDYTARVWDAHSEPLLTTLQGHSTLVNSASYSPDASRIVTASNDHTAQVWDTRSDRLLTTLQGHSDHVNSASYSPDASRIVTASDDHTARVWDAHTGKLLTILHGHSDHVKSASYSPDANRIVTASSDAVRIWDAHTSKLLTTIESGFDIVYSARYSPDANRIVTASSDNVARVWDAHSGKLLTTLQGHSGSLRSASYSPDASRIVTASLDKTARVWDAGSGKLLVTLQGHSHGVYGASYSPDGSRIVTASYDHTARVWDAHSGKLLTILQGHSASVYSASYSPDGSRIVTASGDYTVRVWYVAPENRSTAELQSLIDCRSQQRLEGDVVIIRPDSIDPLACKKLPPHVPTPLTWAQQRVPLWAGIYALQAGAMLAAETAFFEARRRIEHFHDPEWQAWLTLAEAAVTASEQAPAPAAASDLVRRIDPTKQADVWERLGYFTQNGLHRPLWALWADGELQRMTPSDSGRRLAPEARANNLEARLALGLAKDVLRDAAAVLALQPEDSNKAVVAALAWVAAMQQSAHKDERAWAGHTLNLYIAIKDDVTSAWNFKSIRHAFLKQPDSPTRAAALELFDLLEQIKSPATTQQLAKLLQVPLPSKPARPR